MSLRRAGTGARGRGKVCVKILEMTLQAKDFNEAPIRRKNSLNLCGDEAMNILKVTLCWKVPLCSPA